MSAVRLERVEGGVVARKWPRWGVDLLELLVGLADPEVTGPAGERIYPVPSKDLAEAAEWRRTVHPELFSLVSSARDIVATDLAAADRGARGSLKELRISDAHRPAWISALQVARLRLAAEHEVDAAAMRANLAELPEAMRGPVELIDFYGWIQEFLLAPEPGADGNGGDGADGADGSDGGGRGGGGAAPADPAA